MEAELQERLESSQKQASRVVEIYECLKNTVDELKAELDSGAGETEGGNMEKHMKLNFNSIIKFIKGEMYFSRSQHNI